MNGEYGFYLLGRGRNCGPRESEHKWLCGQSMVASGSASTTTSRGRTVGITLSQPKSQLQVSRELPVTNHSTKRSVAARNSAPVSDRATQTRTISDPPASTVDEDPDLARIRAESMLTLEEDKKRASQRIADDERRMQSAMRDSIKTLKEKKAQDELLLDRRTAMARLQSGRHLRVQQVASHTPPAAGRTKMPDVHPLVLRFSQGKSASDQTLPASVGSKVKILSELEVKSSFDRLIRQLPSDQPWEVLNYYYARHPNQKEALKQVADAFLSGRLELAEPNERCLALYKAVLKYLIKEALDDKSLANIDHLMRISPDPHPFKDILLDNLKPLIALAVKARKSDFGRWLEKCRDIDAVLTRNQLIRSGETRDLMNVVLARGDAMSIVEDMTGRLASASVSSAAIAEPHGVMGDPVVYIILTRDDITVNDAIQHREDSASGAYLLTLTKNGETQDLVDKIVLRGPNRLSIGCTTTLKIYVHWPTVDELDVQEVAEAIHQLLTRREVPDDECPQLDFNMIPDPTSNLQCQQFKEDLQLGLVARRAKDVIY